MIISSKTSRSTSNVRRSEALVSRRGFLKRLTAGGVMLAARTVSLWGIVGLAMAATTT
ncbi:MAG: twin-arginine translocation signal domain-containing protein, partial [Planctomycetota bacterium]